MIHVYFLLSISLFAITKPVIDWDQRDLQAVRESQGIEPHPGPASSNINGETALESGLQKSKLKKTDIVVVLLHDSGSRYIGKIYNDEWMISNNFLE